MKNRKVYEYTGEIFKDNIFIIGTNGPLITKTETERAIKHIKCGRTAESDEILIEIYKIVSRNIEEIPKKLFVVSSSSILKKLQRI